MPCESGLLVAAPLVVEAWAVRRGLGDPGAVVRTGMGLARSRRALPRLEASRAAAVAVVGFGGAMTSRLRPGDVVVADEVRGGPTVLRCPSAPLLASALRGEGLTVHCGPVATSGHIVHGAGRDTAARRGVLVADMESAVLACAARDRPRAVVRVVLDTPDRPLARPRTGCGLLAAVRSLRGVGTGLERWAEVVSPRTVFVEGMPGLAGVRAAAKVADVVLVLGGGDDGGDGADGVPDVRTYRADAVGQVRMEWFGGARRIGLVRATSSVPTTLVNECAECVRGLGSTTVPGRYPAAGTTRCTLHEEVRP